MDERFVAHTTRGGRCEVEDGKSGKKYQMALTDRGIVFVNGGRYPSDLSREYADDVVSAAAKNFGRRSGRARAYKRGRERRK